MGVGITAPKLNILLIGNSHADSIKNEFMKVARNNGSNVHFIISNNPLMKRGLSPESIINDAIKKNIDVIVLHYNNRPLPFLQKIIKLNELAGENNIKITLIEPVPHWPVDIPEAMYLGEEPNQNKFDYLNKNNLELYGYKSIASDNFRIVPVVGVFCSAGCQFQSAEGKPLYFDSNHLTLTGASILNGTFEDVIRFYLP